MFTHRLAFLLVLLAITGCRSDRKGPGGSDGDPCLGASIALSPSSPSVTLDGGTPSPIAFLATGTGGAVLDPAELTWLVTRADDTTPGTIVNGVFSPYPNAGGLVTVRAANACTTGQTAVTLRTRRPPPPVVVPART